MDMTAVLDLFMVAMGIIVVASTLRMVRETLDTRASDPSTEPVRRAPAVPAPAVRPGAVVLSLCPPPAPLAAPAVATPGPAVTPVVPRRVFGPFAYGPDGRARRPFA